MANIAQGPISPKARYRQGPDIAQGTVCTVLPRHEVRTRLAVTSNAVTGVRNNKVLPLSRGRGSARGRSGSASVRLSDKLYSPLPCVRHDDLMFEFFDGTNWPPSYGAAGPGPRHAGSRSVGAVSMPLCRSSRRASGLVRWFGGAPSVMQGLIPDRIAEGTTTVGVPWWIYRSPTAAFRLGPWTRPGGSVSRARDAAGFDAAVTRRASMIAMFGWLAALRATRCKPPLPADRTVAAAIAREPHGR
jgi:hypothetical protein